MTSENTLPKGWVRVPLVSKVIFFEGPGILAKDFRASGVPLIRISSVRGKEVTLDGCNYLSSEMVNRQWNHFRLQQEDILISGSASIGMCSRVGEVAEGAIPYTGLISFRNLSGLENSFLEYFLTSLQFKEQIENAHTGSTISHFGPSHLKKMVMDLPEDLKEQQKIAEILSTLDEAIELTQRAIEKQTSIKAGLMQELLTKGLDEHGNIRSETTHQFKDSKLGRIPEEWEVQDIDELTQFLGSGVTPKGGSSIYLDSGTPLIRSLNVHFIGLNTKNLAFISKGIHKKMKRSTAYEGDVLLNITGASIGRVTIIPEGFPESNVNQHVCILRSNNKISSSYLCRLMQSKRGQDHIFNVQAGGNREGLNYHQIRAMKFALPASNIEQKMIVEKLLAIESIFLNLDRKKSKLESVKRGLMAELLTGKTRVTSLLSKDSDV